VIREGFWSQSPGVDPWPKPLNEPWDGQDQFLATLSNVESRVVPISFRGWSSCRLCGKGNGSSEYRTDGATWPAGLAHYIEVHNVRPSQAFIEYINRFQAKQK
jgi:hypothetical protein